MKYLADTNLLSQAISPKCDSRVERWLDEKGDDFGICWATIAELRFGVERMAPGKRRDALQVGVDEMIADTPVVPLTDATARAFARLAAERESRGRTKPFADTVIAAVAIEHGLTVATRITADFPDVPVVNPWDEKKTGDRSQGE